MSRWGIFNTGYIIFVFMFYPVVGTIIILGNGDNLNIVSNLLTLLLEMFFNGHWRKYNEKIINNSLSKKIVTAKVYKSLKKFEN